MKSLWLLPFVFLTLVGCAHSVHLYQANDSYSFQGKLIESDSEQFVIFWFATETQYVEQAFNKLKAQCPSGRIEGIKTRYSTSLGFFSWTNKIRMRGYCLPVVAARTASP
ncbi:MAG: hypothetical protein ACK5Y2_14280 [Bdellovibrionales bacterium]